MNLPVPNICTTTHTAVISSICTGAFARMDYEVHLYLISVHVQQSSQAHVQVMNLPVLNICTPTHTAVISSTCTGNELTCT